MVNAGKDGAEVGTRAQKPVECGKQSACPSNRKARTAARPSSSTPRLSPEARKPGAPSRAAHNSRRRKERSVCRRRAGIRLTGRYPADERVPGGRAGTRRELRPDAGELLLRKREWNSDVRRSREQP